MSMYLYVSNRCNAQARFFYHLGSFFAHFKSAYMTRFQEAVKFMNNFMLSREQVTKLTDADRMSILLGHVPALNAFIELLDPRKLKQLNVIHIAGTSGKGSVSSMISAIMTYSNISNCCHVKPYLQECVEKFSHNSRSISHEEFATLVEHFKAIYFDIHTRKHSMSSHRHPCLSFDEHFPSEVHTRLFEKYSAISVPHLRDLSYVEAWVALTVMWMVNNDSKWAIIETGVGGRFDATNALKSKIQIITPIGLDHTAVLGSCIKEIAWHKAGIIKENGIVVTSVRDQNAISIIEAECSVKQATLFCIDRDFSWHLVDKETGKIDIKAPFNTYHGITVNLRGHFQFENAALSVAAMDILREKFGETSLTIDSIRSGLRSVIFPGRMELIQYRPNVLFLLDVAHNPQKMENLVESVLQQFSDFSFTVLFGAIKGKSSEVMLEHLAKLPGCTNFLFTYFQVSGKEVQSPESLEKEFFKVSIRLKKNIPETQCFQSSECALDSCFRIAERIPEHSKHVILLTGSLYLVGILRNHWYPVRRNT